MDTSLFETQTQERKKHRQRAGFTIVELLIVVVVIAVLAAITVVVYNGITTQAKESALKSNLTTAAKKLQLSKVEDGSFPGSKPADTSSTKFQYTHAADTFCLTATNPQLPGKAFHVTQNGDVQTGACSGHTAGGSGGNEITANSPIQSVTQAQCQALPEFTGDNNEAVRTVTDSRGGISRTYEIGKLADGKCWMLTNLKLGSETGSITLTPSDSNVASDFTLPQVTAPGNSEVDIPRVYGPVPGDTGAGATNYGYLYNWPAAAAKETMPLSSVEEASQSICPAGWRLPTAGVYDPSNWPPTLVTPGDTSALDIAFGGTGNHASSGQDNISKWQQSGPYKGVFSGYSYNGDHDWQGSSGALWSASMFPGVPAAVIHVTFSSVGVHAGDGVFSYRVNLGVRCLLS